MDECKALEHGNAKELRALMRANAALTRSARTAGGSSHHDHTANQLGIGLQSVQMAEPYALPVVPISQLNLSRFGSEFCH